MWSMHGKIHHDLHSSIAQMSHENGVSGMTGQWIVRQDLGMRSRARKKKQKMTPANKEQHVQKCQRLLNRIRRCGSLRIFLDESKVELSPYANSCHDWITEVAAGDRGDIGINLQHHGPGFMILGVWISDGSGWFHTFQARETVIAASCRAMDDFFRWFRTTYTAEQHSGSLLFMDGAPSHMSVATQNRISAAMIEVGGLLIGKGHKPVYNLNLNPLDACGWHLLKKAVCGQDGGPTLPVLRR